MLLISRILIAPICFLFFAPFAHSQDVSGAEKETPLTSTPTAYPTGTTEPTDYDFSNSLEVFDQEDPSFPISCNGFALENGTTTIIDSEETCKEACADRHLYYWPYFDHDHFQYTSFDRVYDDDGVVNRSAISAVGECTCDDYVARGEKLCGPTEYLVEVPEEPLPPCSDIGVEYFSACSRTCSSLYPTDNYYRDYDWRSDWSFSRGQYRQSCTCVLNERIRVEICDGFGPKYNPNGSYDYGDEGHNIFPFLVILAVFGLGACLCVVKKSPNEQDPALTEYRQQQQRRQQAATSANASQPTEEELAARGDIVRSNLFSHTLTEDDDVKNFTSIISSISSSAFSRNNADDGNWAVSSSPPTSGDGTGFLDTLRSSLSSKRLSIRSINQRAECSICLMGYSADETISWAKEEGCDHVYHQECIVGWLSTAKRDGSLHDSCPLCRTKLVTETNVGEA